MCGLWQGKDSSFEEGKGKEGSHVYECCED